MSNAVHLITLFSLSDHSASSKFVLLASSLIWNRYSCLTIGCAGNRASRSRPCLELQRHRTMITRPLMLRSKDQMGVHSNVSALHETGLPYRYPIYFWTEGVFKLELFLPEEYPMSPPVRFLTKIYHPNIGVFDIYFSLSRPLMFTFCSR